MTLVSAGRVGRPHGRDGSFWVEEATHPLPLGLQVTVGDREHRVERRSGSAERPLLRLSGLSEPRALRGESLLVNEELEEGEYLAADIVGCRVAGRGEVRALLDGPSCSLLELESGELVPLVSDAVRSIDLERRVIEVDEGFLAP